MKYELLNLKVEHIPFFYDVRFSVEENMLLPQHIQYLQREMLISDVTQGGGWIALVDGNYVGVGFGILTPEPLIGGLFIKPEFQSIGIGSAILSEIENWFAKSGSLVINLTTDKKSKAESFYISKGWVYDGCDEYGQAKYYKCVGI